MALGWSNTASRPGPDNSDPYKMLKKQNVQINEKKDENFDHRIETLQTNTLTKNISKTTTNFNPTQRRYDT